MNTKPIFAYVFFSLFVFVAFSLLVSNFSSTFSQLFSIFSKNGGVFQIFIYCLDLFGFLLCLCTLILSSWNHKSNSKIKSLVFILAIVFIFLFVFELQNPHQSFSSLEILGESKSGFEELFRLGEFLFFSAFYAAFVFFPLVVFAFKKPSFKKPSLLDRYFVSKKTWAQLAYALMPSINVVIYAMMGFALQSYFHKSYGFFYLDLLGFLIACLLLWRAYTRCKNEFGFYEISHLIFLCAGIVIFAFSSKIITNQDFMARYVFLTFAFVSWCAEWMLKFLKGEIS